LQDETLVNLEIRLVPPAGACGLVGPSNLLATASGVSRFLAAFVFGLIGWGWGVEAARAAPATREIASEREGKMETKRGSVTFPRLQRGSATKHTQHTHTQRTHMDADPSGQGWGASVLLL